MKTLRLITDFTYDDDLMYVDEEGQEWFHQLLIGDLHPLHSNEIGDFIGDIQVLAIYDNHMPVLNFADKQTVIEQARKLIQDTYITHAQADEVDSEFEYGKLVGMKELFTLLTGEVYLPSPR